MGITIGIDVGTVSTKCALFGAAERLKQIAASGDALCSVFDYAPEPDKAVAVSGYRRIQGKPLDAVVEQLRELTGLLEPGELQERRHNRIIRQARRRESRHSRRERVQGRRDRDRADIPRCKEHIRDGRRELEVHPRRLRGRCHRDHRLRDERRLRRRHRIVHGPAVDQAAVRNRRGRRTSSSAPTARRRSRAAAASSPSRT